ncbi:trypsin-like isoform X2 [Symsagittifera roscoffensis]|uniref:trypsin-like isoform X2 n=1 Tax=Symsagittifera roscoffensis TaxID=84072 RepID=UPI00307C1D71
MSKTQLFLNFLFTLLLIDSFSAKNDSSIDVKSSLVQTIVNGVTPAGNLFFVRIQVNNSERSCAGAIVDERWVVTSALCISHESGQATLPAELRILVRMVDTSSRGGKRIKATDIVIPANFNQSLHQNDLALIRLQRSVPKFRILEICQNYPASFDTLVIAVGHGSIARGRFKPSGFLREIKLKISPFQTIDSWLQFDVCPMNLVCTETFTEDSGLCYNDDGSPLFLRGCFSQRPLCLLGIATPTLKDESPLRDCKGQADFTSIPYFHDWIFTRIALNMD